MKKLFKNNLWIAGILLGAGAGYLYWENIGCLNGSCAITSKPLNSMIYFSILGGLLFNMLQPKRRPTGNDVTVKEDGIE